MNKKTDPKPKYSKEVNDFIYQHEQFEKQMVSLTKGCKKQLAEINKITRKVAIANREIKKQEDEIKRLKYNLRNLLP